MSDEVLFDKTYVCVPRNLIYDVLEKRLSHREFDALVWLYLKANYRNGIHYISYAGLADELQISGKDKINAATKLVHSLKKNGFISFEKRQGRRGTFSLRINNYFTPEALRALRNKPGEQISSTPVITPNFPFADFTAELGAGFTDSRQKSHDQNRALLKAFQPEYFAPLDRSANNDNENDSREGKNSVTLKSQKYDTERFIPESYEEEQCLRIATKYEETSVAFLLSKYKEAGLNVILDAEEITDKAVERGNIEDPRKYFNGVLTNLIAQRA